MSPFQLLFALFIIVPVIEIYLLIEVGGLIGAIPTILLIILTAIAGAFLLRAQGLSTMHRLQETLRQGEVPAIEMVEGMMLLVGGALLLTPGFFTDTIGFICLIPPLRRWFIQSFVLHYVGNASTGPHPQGHHTPKTIEGEFKREPRD
ncbi:MAG: FxsA family protein [Gammaproteobacteria bacterium]|nr:FxsA family protein [Gammaproteobacteria bacterium]